MKVFGLKQIKLKMDIQVYYPYLIGLKGAEDSFAADFNSVFIGWRG